MIDPADADLIARLREGTIAGADGDVTYLQDDQTILDAAALLAALRARPDDDFDRESAVNIYGELQAGNLLSAMQIAKLRELLSRYADEVAAARSEGDYPDPLNQPDPNEARIITGGPQ